MQDTCPRAGAYRARPRQRGLHRPPLPARGRARISGVRRGNGLGSRHLQLLTPLCRQMSGTRQRGRGHRRHCGSGHLRPHGGSLMHSPTKGTSYLATVAVGPESEIPLPRVYGVHSARRASQLNLLEIEHPLDDVGKPCPRDQEGEGRPTLRKTPDRAQESTLRKTPDRARES
jgi:hypothetical protein